MRMDGRRADPKAPRPPPPDRPAGCTIPWVPRTVSPKIGLLDQVGPELRA